MKSLLVLGTIAALALSTTAEAKGNKDKNGKKAARQGVSRQQVYNAGTTRYAPARTRTVAQRYSNGSYANRSYNSGSYGNRSYRQPLLRQPLLRRRVLRRRLSVLWEWFVILDRHWVRRLLRLSWVWYGYGYPYYSNYGYGGYPYGYNSYGSGYYDRGYGLMSSWKSSSVLRGTDTTTA